MASWIFPALLAIIFTVWLGNSSRIQFFRSQIITGLIAIVFTLLVACILHKLQLSTVSPIEAKYNREIDWYDNMKNHKCVKSGFVGRYITVWTCPDKKIYLEPDPGTF